jgi:hypothetical protein
MNYLYALLIGIDCYLPNKLPDGASYKSLKGCVRDINHVEAFLKRQFNLPSEQIYKLTASNVDGSDEPSEAYSNWPTYEKYCQDVSGSDRERLNIKTKCIFTTLVTADVQQQFIQHLSKKKDLMKRLFSLILAKPTSRYLRDLELAALLQKMVGKGLLVTVVLDSCHSGGATRAGASDIRRRWHKHC